ncbi:MAG: hypothetical protein JOZ22_11270 [Acidobacteriia bacterium]|nr:hypothetical protein [Terriglobia bacterium]
MALVESSFINTSSDDLLLRAFVATAVRVLNAIVNGDTQNTAGYDTSFVYPNARQLFQDNWNGFKEAADKVVGTLRDISSALWEKLQNAGLTLGHLRMKWFLLWQDLLSGRWNLILRRVDSILKSLASAIGLGECLAEYKEHVEMTITGLEKMTGGDCTGFIDLESAA